MGFQAGIWYPHLLGRKNNLEMLDPRIGILLGKDGRPMKRETGAFPGCANSYGVYDLVGNVHEIVADAHITKNFRKNGLFWWVRITSAPPCRAAQKRPKTT